MCNCKFYNCTDMYYFFVLHAYSSLRWWFIAGKAYAVGEFDRIWSAGSCQIVAVFSEIQTLAMQVSGDMNSSVKYLSKPGMQKSKDCN
jgi:hypothetical protein